VPQALGGLQNGVTYTVFNPTGSSFQLKDAGGNLVTGLSLNEATGTHYLSKEGGVDLTATGEATPSHSLRFDFVGPTASVTNKLLTPDLESLRTVNAAATDGPSTVSANGGGFGFLGVDAPTAHATFGA